MYIYYTYISKTKCQFHITSTWATLRNVKQLVFCLMFQWANLYFLVNDIKLSVTDMA